MTSDDEMEMYFENSTSGTSFLESLIKCRSKLLDSSALAVKLDSLIDEELDLALMGAQKAKSEILKNKAKDNLRPIK